MTKIIASGNIDLAKGRAGVNYFDVDVLLLYPHREAIQDMNGNEVLIDNTLIANIAKAYNQRVELEARKLKHRLKKIIGKKEILLAPVYLEHEDDIRNIVGRVLGEVWTLEEAGDLSLYAKIRVLGQENVIKVKDQRYRDVSIGFNLETYYLNEISFVSVPAVKDAGVILNFSGSKRQVALKLAEDYRKHGEKLASLKTDYNLTRKVLKLMQSGKILPRDIKRVVTDLKLMRHGEDQAIALRLLQALPNAVDFSIYSNNKQAKNLEEIMLMADNDKHKTIGTIEKAVARALIRFKKKQDKNKGEKVLAEDETDNKDEITASDNKFDQADWQRANELFEGGKHEELGAFLHTKLSEAKDDEDDEADENEEADLSKHLSALREEIVKLSSSQEALKIELGKMAGTHEFIDSFMKKIAQEDAA